MPVTRPERTYARLPSVVLPKTTVVQVACAACHAAIDLQVVGRVSDTPRATQYRCPACQQKALANVAGQIVLATKHLKPRTPG